MSTLSQSDPNDRPVHPNSTKEKEWPDGLPGPAALNPQMTATTSKQTQIEKGHERTEAGHQAQGPGREVTLWKVVKPVLTIMTFVHMSQFVGRIIRYRGFDFLYEGKYYNEGVVGWVLNTTLTRG